MALTDPKRAPWNSYSRQAFLSVGCIVSIDSIAKLADGFNTSSAVHVCVDALESNHILAMQVLAAHLHDD